MLKVKEVMTKSVTTFTPDTLVKDAAAVLALRNISGAPVVEGGKIVGIFSEADVLRSLKTSKKDMRLIYPSISSLGIAFQEEVTQREIIEAYNDIGQKPVKEVMSTHVVTVPPDIPLNEVIVQMVQKGINRLPVVDNNVLVGIITRGDVIRGLAVEQAAGKTEKK
ncbi:MAG: CBS domain-containing protein [Thermoplasmata archaeon]|jgi:CBS domain-containing protein